LIIKNASGHCARLAIAAQTTWGADRIVVSSRLMEETPRASDLQLHVEQVNLALRQLRQTQESLGGLEARLAEMTRECAGILDRWHDNDQRHATAVVELHSRLNEWNDIERRLLAESSTRIHQFERGLQHEWNTIRHAHEEPLRQIEAQTTRITETCLTAVSQALQGFDRAESRLASLEQDLHREVGTLVKEVREALAEMRQGAPQIGPRQPWSLDNVVKLHNELRAEGTGPTAPSRGTLALAEALEPEPLPAMPVERQTEAASIVEPVAAEPQRSTRRWIFMTGAAAALVALALYTSSQVREGLREAAARAAAAERGADQARTEAAAAVAAAQESDRRMQDAQRASRVAERLAAVAAAPDARRFELAATDGAGTAQIIWSRTAGVTVTASGLAPTTTDQAYQVWLLSPGLATSVGLITVDGSGAARQVFDATPGLPRPILRAMITREPAAGSATPTAPAVLVTPPPPPAVTP
jgi:hypothetical protein